MKKMLHNRNVWLLAGLLVVIIAVLLASKGIQKKPDTLPENLPAIPAGDSEAAPAELPLGFIRALANGESKWLPLPTGDEEVLITIGRQNDPAVSNTLRLWKNGFRMDSSTCDNQDCVMQGDVTLENMDSRVLMHMVLCLPHDVAVELYSTEELLAMNDQQQEQ